jgi:hypothetical protein
MIIELVLQLFVGKVYTQLLKGVGLEYFKPKDV